MHHLHDAVGGGAWDIEIDWELVNDLGVTVASGFARRTVSVCLPNGCYTMYMYDLFGDGWNGATYVVRVQPTNTIVSSRTLTLGLSGPPGESGRGLRWCELFQLYAHDHGRGLACGDQWNLVTGTLIVATGFAQHTSALFGYRLLRDAAVRQLR